MFRSIHRLENEAAGQIRYGAHRERSAPLSKFKPAIAHMNYGYGSLGSIGAHLIAPKASQDPDLS